MTPQEIITEAKRKVCIKHNKPEYFAYQVQDEITLEAVKLALSIDSVSVSSFLSDKDIDLNTPIYFDSEPQATERSKGWNIGAKWARDRILNNLC